MELRLTALLALCVFFGAVSAAHVPSRRQQINERHQQQVQHGSQLDSETQLEHLLKELCPQVKDEVKREVPAKFAELVNSLSSLPSASISRLDKKIKDGEFCSSKKLHDIWSDALIMDASEGSLKLMARQIMNKEVSPARANYLLTMMAFAKKPTPGAVRAVLPILEQNDIPRQGLLGISALIKNSWTFNGYQKTPEIRDAIRAIGKYMTKNIKNSDRVIVALKALQNIQSIDDVLEDVLSLASDKSQKTSVRVAAIESLRGVALPEVRSKVMEIFEKSIETAEVRIAAYKLVIERADKHLVQRIISILKTEENKQVGAFIVSHLKNLEESSSPRLQAVREIIKDERIPVDRFPQDIRKYSRNFELSRYIEKLSVGGIFESDLIYDRSFAPRSFKVNMTLPVQDDEINVLEVGFRQVGLDHQIRKLVGPEGLLNGQNFPEVVSEIMEFLMEDEDSNEVESRRVNSRFPRAVSRKSERRSQIMQKLQAEDAVEGSLYITLAGKTIAYLDINDLSNPDNDMTQIVKSLKDMIKRSDLETDRAFSFMFLNKKYGKTPASVNGTVIVALKSDRTGVWPSVALELSTRTSGKKFVQRLASSPALRFDRQSKKMTLSLPNDRQTLFSVASEVFEIDSEGIERPVAHTDVDRKEKCSSVFNTFLGIEVCSKTVKPRKTFEHGLPPFNGLWNLDLEIVKTDRSMTGWEFGLELPEGRKTNFKASFDTPRSSINRRVSLEAEIMNYRGIRVHLESPRKTVEVTTSYELDASEVSYKVHAVVDRSNKYAFEAGVKRSTSGRKSEFTPVLRITAPSMKPIAVTGTVLLEKGKKSQISFDLKSENNQNRYVKGSLVKEGSVTLNKDFRLSTDCQADFGFLSLKVFGSGEKKDTSLSSDLKIEYQTPNSRKQSVKLIGKLQNLSSSQQKKINSFFEVQLSQFPSKNLHVSWNVVSKPDEKLENELTIMWDGLLRDPSKKIHILQVSKFTGFMSKGRTLTSDNIISIEVAPIDFRYDIKASGHMERSKQTPKYKVQFEVNNKNRKDQDVQVTFEYQHISAEPLKMAIDASLLTPSGEIRYSDRIEEIAPKVFKGKTQLQWHQDRKTTIDYTLKVRNDASKIDLELDSDLKTPSMTFGLHHQGLLRITRNQVELQSKMNHERSNIYELKADLNKKSKSTVHLLTKKFNGKLETLLTGPSKNALVDITSEDWSHNTNLVVAHDAVTLASKTLSEQKPILIINARKSKRDSTRFNLESTLIDARFDVSKSTPKTVSFEIKQKVGEKVNLKGKTTIRSPYDVEASLEGKSASFTPRSVDFKVKRDSRDEASLEILSKENNREWITTRASYALKDKFNYNILVSNRGIEVVRVDAKFDRRPLQGPHDLQVQFSRKGSKEVITGHHEIDHKRIETYIRHNKDGQLERTAEIVLKGNKVSSHETDIEADLKIKNQRKSLDAHITHQHNLQRHGYESTCTGKVLINGRDNFETKIVSQLEGKSTGKAFLQVEVKTPKKNWEQQLGEIKADWDVNRIRGAVKVQNHENKQMIVSAEASRQDKYKVVAEIKSDFKKVPSVSFEGAADKKTLFLASKLNNKEILKVEGKADYDNIKSFRGQLEGKTSVTPRYTVTIEGKKLGKQIQYTLDASQDGEKVLTAQSHHEEQRDSYRNTIRVTLDKKDIDASIESVINKNLALGPHDIDINGNFPRSPKRTLKIHHELVDGQIKEHAKYFVAGEEKTSVSASGNYRRERSVFSIDLLTRVKNPAIRSVEHEGLLRFGQQIFELNSKLSLDSKNIYDAKSLISRQDKSYLIVESEAVRGKLAVSPFTEEKTALFEVAARGYEHSTEARINKREASLKSRTLKNTRQIVLIDISGSPKTAGAQVECPAFSGLVKYDVESLPKTVSFELNSKNRDQLQVKGKTSIHSVYDADLYLQGKTASTPLRSLNLKVKREDKKAFVDIRSQEDNREFVTARASYDHSPKSLVYQLNVSKKGEEVARVDAKIDRRVAHGPHDLEVAFLRKGRQQNLKLKHELKAGEVKTSAIHVVDGRQEGFAEVRANVQKKSHGIDIDSEVTLKSEKKFKGINEVQAKFTHRHEVRKNFVDVDTLLKGSLNDDRTAQASFQVKHDKTESLKMKVDAAIILPNKRVIRYSDNLVEVAPQVFKGETRVQWQQDKEASMDYTLKVRNDRNKIHLEHECQVKTPSMTFGSNHNGLLRLTRKFDELEVRSQLVHERNNVWDLKADLKKDDNSHLNLVTKRFSGKIEASSLKAPAKTVNADLTVGDWKHSSDFVMANDAITVNSKTLEGQRPVVVVEFRKSNKDSTRFNLESAALNAKLDVNSRSSPKTALFEIKQKKGEKVHLKGSTTIRSLTDAEFALEGKTASVSPKSLTLKVKKGEHDAEIEITSHDNSQQLVSSQVSYSLANKLNTKVQITKRGVEILRLDGKFDRKAIQGPHDLDVVVVRKGSKHVINGHHEILDNQVKLSASHSKDGQLERTAEIVLRGNKLSKQEADLDAELKLKCRRHAVDAKITHQHNWGRKSIEFTSSAKALINGKDYEAKIVSQADKRSQGKAQLNVEVKTPINNFERQIVEVSGDWKNDAVKINGRVQDAKNKNLIISAEASRQDKYKIVADIKSDFKKIPSVSIEGAADETTLFVVSRLDNKEILKVEGNADYKMSSGLKQFKGKLVGKTSVTPRYTVEVDAKKVGHELQYKLEASEDEQRIVSARASHEEQRNSYRDTVQITLTKMEIDMNLEASINKNLALGPHDVEINTVSAGSAKRTVRLHHEVKEGQMNEHAKYLVGGQERTAFVASGKKSRGVYEMESKVVHKNKNVYEAKAYLSKKDKSYIKLESEALKGRLEVIPFGSQKTALLEVKGKHFEHLTEAKIASTDASITSKTMKGNRQIAFVDARGNLSSADAQIHSPFFDSRLKYDVSDEASPKHASVDFQSKIGRQIQFQKRIEAGM